MSKLETLAKSEGYTTVNQFLMARALDSVVPGICVRPDCDLTTEVEPDQDRGWCESCEANTVKSGCILAGII